MIKKKLITNLVSGVIISIASTTPGFAVYDNIYDAFADKYDRNSVGHMISPFNYKEKLSSPSCFSVNAESITETPVKIGNSPSDKNKLLKSSGSSSFKMIASSQEELDEFGVDVSTEASYGMFSASASFGMNTSQYSDQNAIKAMMKSTRHKYRKLKVPEVKLTTEGERAITQLNQAIKETGIKDIGDIDSLTDQQRKAVNIAVNQFFAQCGGSYVISKVQLGKALNYTMTFTSESSAFKREFNTEAGASVSSFVEINTKISSSHEENESQINVSAEEEHAGDFDYSIDMAAVFGCSIEDNKLNEDCKQAMESVSKAIKDLQNAEFSNDDPVIEFPKITPIYKVMNGKSKASFDPVAIQALQIVIQEFDKTGSPKYTQISKKYLKRKNFIQALKSVSGESLVDFFPGNSLLTKQLEQQGDVTISTIENQLNKIKSRLDRIDSNGYMGPHDVKVVNKRIQEFDDMMPEYLVKLLYNLRTNDSEHDISNLKGKYIQIIDDPYSDASVNIFFNNNQYQEVSIGQERFTDDDSQAISQFNVLADNDHKLTVDDLCQPDKAVTKIGYAIGVKQHVYPFIIHTYAGKQLDDQCAIYIDNIITPMNGAQFKNWTDHKDRDKELDISFKDLTLEERGSGNTFYNKSWLWLLQSEDVEEFQIGAYKKPHIFVGYSDKGRYPEETIDDVEIGYFTTYNLSTDKKNPDITYTPAGTYEVHEHTGGGDYQLYMTQLIPKDWFEFGHGHTPAISYFDNGVIDPYEMVIVRTSHGPHGYKKLYISLARTNLFSQDSDHHQNLYQTHKYATGVTPDVTTIGGSTVIAVHKSANDSSLRFNRLKYTRDDDFVTEVKGQQYGHGNTPSIAAVKIGENHYIAEMHEEPKKYSKYAILRLLNPKDGSVIKESKLTKIEGTLKRPSISKIKVNDIDLIAAVYDIVKPDAGTKNQQQLLIIDPLSGKVLASETFIGGIQSSIAVYETNSSGDALNLMVVRKNAGTHHLEKATVTFDVDGLVNKATQARNGVSRLSVSK